MNLGFAVCDIAVYDTEGNLIEGGTMSIYTVQGVEIGGIGLVADVKIVEKVPDTVRSLVATLEMDVISVEFDKDSIHWGPYTLSGPFYWYSGDLDWTEKLNQEWRYESGQLWTDEQLENAIIDSLPAVNLRPPIEFYQSLKGIPLTINISIGLSLESSGDDGPFPTVRRIGYALLVVIYDEATEGGIEIVTWTIQGLITQFVEDISPPEDPDDPEPSPDLRSIIGGYGW